MTKVKNGIKIIVFIAIFAMIFGTIQKLTLPYFTEEQGTNSGFLFEEENTVDVLFLGTSNMFHTINPLVLYEESGIRGFDFGSSAQSLNMSHMYLKEAFKTQSPKVVCLEVYMVRGAFNEVGTGIGEPELRWGYTYFPTSVNKLVRLYDQVDGMIDADYLSYLFPLFRYKSIWWSVGKDNFAERTEPHYRKGSIISTKVEPVSYHENYFENTGWKIAESNIASLDAIKELCKKNGAELVFFKGPNISRWKEEYSKAVANYAAENGIYFLDYNPIIDEIGISLDTSFMSGGHLNLEGATAATKYMAKYLKSNFELEDYRNGEENSWDRACAEWHRREQNDVLAVVGDLETYLDIVSGDGYTVTFSINGDIDEPHRNLLLSKFRIDTASGVESAVINDGIPLALNGRGISYLWREELDGQDYAIAGNRRENSNGNVSYDTALYVNGVNCSVVQRGINIVVYDNELQEFVSVVGFDAGNKYAKYVGNLKEIQR